MNNPLISIIVPCYKQACYLEEALQSVLAQTYTNWECIIVNDGSPDNTEEIALEWGNKDKRFKYVYKDNGGLSSARNAGIEIAVGVFILPLDADDKIGEDYIKLGIEAFNDNPELKVVYCKAEKFGLVNGFWNLKPFSLESLAIDNMIFCSAIFKKEDWVKVGGYDEKMVFGLEDYEFWIALLKKGGQVLCLNYLGFFYRIKSDSMLKQLDKEKINYLLEYLSVKHSSFFVQQFGSFHLLNEKINLNIKKMKSKKFAINLFFKNLFGFYVIKDFR